MIYPAISLQFRVFDLFALLEITSLLLYVMI